MKEAGPGFHVPPVTELFEWAPIATIHLGGLALNISWLVIFMFATIGLVAFLFVAAFAKPKMVPRGLQNLLEIAINFVRENIVIPTIGPGGDKWMPLLSTMFFFTFALNFLEVVPGIQFPITSRMAFPAMMAVLAWLIFNYVGVKEQGFFGYLRATLFPPGVPKPVYLILTPIEFFSTFIVRPLTLAVRLFANMMAGHVMLTIFFLASGYFLYRADAIFLKILSPFPIIMSIALLGFEVFIGAIQAFIITILTAVYIGGAAHAEH